MGDFDTILESVKNMKKELKKNMEVEFFVSGNDKTKSQNPKYYSYILEKGLGNISGTGRNYAFLKPGINMFKKDNAIKVELKRFLKGQLKRRLKKRGRSERQLLNMGKKIGELGIESIQEYIIDYAPQYEERRRKNPSLIDTGVLYDSLSYRVLVDKTVVFVGR